MKTHWMRIVLLVSASLGWTVVNANAADELSHIRELERAGNLRQAYREIVANEKLAKQQSAHVVVLARAVDALTDAERLAELQNYVMAAQGLAKAIETLDPVLAGAVRAGLAKHRISLETRARLAADTVADSTLHKADILMSRRRYEDASAAYGTVAAMNGGEISDDRLLRARLGKLRAETVKAQHAGIASDVQDSIEKALPKVTEWLIYVACALGLWKLFSFSRRFWPARAETVLSMEDLTAATGGASASTGREAANRALTREMSARMATLANGSGGECQIDEMDDLDGAGSVNLRVVVAPSSETSSIVQSATPVSVGPFSISPAQLLAATGAFFRRPFQHTIMGSLAADGDEVVLTLERLDRHGNALPGEHWEVRAQGDDRREKALLGGAEQVAFALSKSVATSDWHSYRDYRSGIRALEAEYHADDREACLMDACKSLQASLNHDPANCLARFYLATVLRKLGKNGTAAQHLRFLLDLLSQRRNEKCEFAAYLKTHPEIYFIVNYNWAVALSKCDDMRSREMALLLLEEIVKQTPRERAAPAGAEREGPARPMQDSCTGYREVDEISRGAVDELNKALKETGGKSLPGISEELSNSLPPDQCERFMMFARAARTVAICMRLDYMSRPQRTHRSRNDAEAAEQVERLKVRQQRMVDAIECDVAWISSFMTSMSRVDWKAYTYTCAVMNNSLGRARYLIGNVKAAQDALCHAIMLMPDFVDAYTNLGAVYLKGEGRLDADWIARARENLEAAIKLSPSNKKAHYLLGKLYADDAVADYPAALKEFEKSDAHWLSYWQMGTIRIQHTNEVDAGLEDLRRSFALHPSPDYRYRYFVRWVIDEATRGPEFLELLTEARQLAKDLARKGASAGDKKAGEALLAELEAIPVKEEPAPAASTPAAVDPPKVPDPDPVSAAAPCER